MNAIAIVGSVNLDTIYVLPETLAPHSKLRAESKTKSLGGSATITAAWMGRFGRSVKLYGHVGNDVEGSWCLEQLAKCPNVDCTGVEVIDGETSTAVSLVNGSDKRIVTYRRSMKHRPLASADLTGVDHLHIVHPDGDVAFEDDLRRHLSRNPTMTVSIELNGRTGDPYVQHADLAFANEDEVNRTFGVSFDQRNERFATMMPREGSMLVVTCGSNGAIAIARDSTSSVPALQDITVIDRTGAGDAFNAGYLTSFVVQATPEECLQAGIATASECLAGIGGIPWL
jgi:sugar/nucleoside kinase (ribokinase family)